MLVGGLRRAVGWTRYAGRLGYSLTQCVHEISFAGPRQPLAAQRHIQIAAFDAPTPLLPYMLWLGQGSGRGCPAAAVCIAAANQLSVEDTIRSPDSSCIHKNSLHTPDRMTSEHFPVSTAATPIRPYHDLGLSRGNNSDSGSDATGEPNRCKSVDESLSLGAILG